VSGRVLRLLRSFILFTCNSVIFWISNGAVWSIAIRCESGSLLNCDKVILIGVLALHFVQVSLLLNLLHLGWKLGEDAIAFFFVKYWFSISSYYRSVYWFCSHAVFPIGIIVSESVYSCRFLAPLSSLIGNTSFILWLGICLRVLWTPQQKTSAW